MSSWDCSAYCLRSLVTVMETPAGSLMMLSVLLSCAMLVLPAPLLALPARAPSSHILGHCSTCTCDQTIHRTKQLHTQQEQGTCCSTL